MEREVKRTGKDSEVETKYKGEYILINMRKDSLFEYPKIR